MKSIRQKGDDCSDITAGDVFPYPVAIMVVIVVICAIVLLLSAAVTKSNNDSAVKHNEQTAAFNDLPLADRQAIATWTGDEKIDPETYLMSEKPTDTPLFLLERIHGSGNVVRVLPFYLGGLVVIFSLLVFGFYWHEKYSHYYLCTLPFDRPYGWVLFFCMFAGWPFLLVSFVCMRVQQSEFYREQHQKRQVAREQRRKARAQEEAAVQKLAEEELAEIARGMTRPAFPERAHRALVTYVVNGQPKAYKARVQEATQNVNDAKSQLQKAGASVQQAQKRLGFARAELDQLESSYAEAHSREKAEADWIAIRNARGVSSVVYNKRRKRLEILIKVRVPYEGELYDFGDYCFYIDGSSNCRCIEIRSGVKLTHTSTAPHYHLSGGRFCFGSSLSTIEDYLRDGRYVEAVILAIECLHSVNGSYDASKIPDCFRKVSVVEDAKQRILRRNKLISWTRRVMRI